MDHFLNAEAGLAWYCARTQPKHEHIAARDLTARFGVEVFNPRLKIERATRRGVVKTVESLFPCYLFIRCHLAAHIEQIRYAIGMSSLVHFGDKVPTLSDEVIEDLRQCFESEEPMMVKDPVRVGSQVTVAEGSFLGSQGIVVKVLQAKQRVQILLDFLGRTTLTEVDRNSLIVEDRSMADLMPSLAMAA